MLHLLLLVVELGLGLALELLGKVLELALGRELGGRGLKREHGRWSWTLLTTRTVPLIRWMIALGQGQGFRLELTELLLWAVAHHRLEPAAPRLSLARLPGCVVLIISIMYIVGYMLIISTQATINGHRLLLFN